MANTTKYVPQGNNPVSTNNLLEQSLRVGGFTSLKHFYETAFADKFGGVQWTKLFKVAQPTFSETYTQVKSEKGLPVMARYVSFDAEAPLIGKDAIEVQSGSMPKMMLATLINEKSLKETVKIINTYGGTPTLDGIFENFLVDNTKLIGGLHSQINYTGYQVESTGKYISTKENNAGGVEGLEFDFRVPSENRKKCGGYGGASVKKAWSDPDADPIADLKAMAQYAEDKLIPVGVFRMNKATWNLFINHPKVKVAVGQFAGGYLISADSAKSMHIGKDAVVKYFDSLDIPQIEVVDALSVAEVWDKDSRKLVKKNVRSFADNTVVLRPQGTIGTLQWSTPSLDFATNDNPAFLTENGKFAVRKFVDAQRQSMKFQVDFVGLPVLDIPDYMLYLNTSEAES